MISITKLRLAIGILVVALVAPATAVATHAFSDVDDTRFFAAAVEWAATNDITTGTSPTTFDPDLPVTRGESVTFLNRYDTNIVQPALDDRYTKTESDGRYYTQAQVDVITDPTQTMAINGSAFVASGTDDVARTGGGCAYNSSSTGPLYASVQVPIGYMVTAAQGAFIDSNAADDPTVRIIHGSADNTDVGTISSTGSVVFQQGVAGTIISEMVVNPGEWLWLVFEQNVSSGTEQVCAVELTLSPG